MRGSKGISVWAALAGLLLVSGPAAAQTPWDKLERGFVDVVTSPIEIPGTIKEESTATNPVQGLTVGLLKGTFRFVQRGAVGLYQMVTFRMAGDSDYGPVLDPERAWHRFD